jgi:hypothetical protein
MELFVVLPDTIKWVSTFLQSSISIYFNIYINCIRWCQGKWIVCGFVAAAGHEVPERNVHAGGDEGGEKFAHFSRIYPGNQIFRPLVKQKITRLMINMTFNEDLF